jgi:hypothetical protein
VSEPIIVPMTHEIRHKQTIVGNVYRLGRTILVVWRHTNDELTVEVFPDPIPDSAMESWANGGLEMVKLGEASDLKLGGEVQGMVYTPGLGWKSKEATR